MLKCTIATFCVVLLSGCHHERSERDELLSHYTEITHIELDKAMCPCCGGWFLEMDGKTYYTLRLAENWEEDFAGKTGRLLARWARVENVCSPYSNTIEIIHLLTFD